MVNITSIYLYEFEIYLWEIEFLFIIVSFYLLILCNLLKLDNKLRVFLILSVISLDCIIIIWFPFYIFFSSLYTLYFYLKFIIFFFYSILLIYVYNNLYLTYKNEIFFLLNISLISLCILLQTQNLITFLLCIELFSYIFYILIASKNFSILAIESAIKYIIIGALSTAFFLLGICLLYFETGSFNISNISYIILILKLSNLFSFNIINFAFLFLLIGLLIKLGTIPFHLWYLDIYYTLDYFLLLYIISISKISLITFLFSLSLHYYFIELFFIKNFLYILSIFCIIFGNLLLLLQFNIKKYILYYTIQSNSFVIIFVCLQYEWNLLIIYMFSYILSFFYFILLLSCLNFWNLNKSIENFYTLFSIVTVSPIITYHLVLNFLVLSTMPPFILFISKFLILMYLNKLNLFILIIILFLSTLGLFVNLRLINICCFNIQYSNINFYSPISQINSTIISFLSLIIFFYWPLQPLINYILLYIL